jgi:anti-anti-sigma factor
MSEPERHGALTLIRLNGRLDGKAAQALQTNCEELRNQGFRHLALDLSLVTFLASSGLGVFLAQTEEFKEGGGSLHLVAVSSVVAAVINLLNVDRFLSMASSVEELETTIST